MDQCTTFLPDVRHMLPSPTDHCARKISHDQAGDLDFEVACLIRRDRTRLRVRHAFSTASTAFSATTSARNEAVTACIYANMLPCTRSSPSNTHIVICSRLINVLTEATISINTFFSLSSGTSPTVGKHIVATHRAAATAEMAPRMQAMATLT